LSMLWNKGSVDMRLTLPRRINALIATGIVLITVVAGAGYLASSTFTTGMALTSDRTKGLQNHMEGDMMHDALRADASAALLADSAEAAENLRRELAEHTKTFREVL